MAKDPHEQVTKDLPIKRRGRPSLGDAPMTPAEKQKAYRDRQSLKKSNVTDCRHNHIEQINDYANALISMGDLLNKCQSDLAACTRELSLTLDERTKAFKAIQVLTDRLSAAGLSTEYRS